MSTTPTNKTAETLASLRGIVCPHCRESKRPRNAFCPRCFFTLPQQARADLYRRIGHGYEEAFERAKSILEDAKTHRTPAP